MLSPVYVGLALLAAQTYAREPSKLQRSALPHQYAVRESAHSLNVSSCPGTSMASSLYETYCNDLLGYTLSGLQETKTGLTASLSLAGAACNAFGQDVANLTLEVTYDSDTRYASIFL